MYPIVRANNRTETLLQKKYILSNGDELEYLSFPALEEIPEIQHIFSTRLGGVSDKEFSTLNFSFIRGDNPGAVLENYRRVGEVFGSSCKSFVTTDQTHSTNIRVVNKTDMGKGVVCPREYSDVDGLITKEKGLVLSCFFADCVPLYFVDRKKMIIGLAHSGWRGTVEGMGAYMVKRMREEFDCLPTDIIAGIGPSICQSCYEISEEVACRFRENFWKESCVAEYCKEACENVKHYSSQILVPGKSPDKWQLDLWLANYVILRGAGIPVENISITDVCTCCNPSYLFSHRATGGKRGNLGAFLMLKG